GGGGGLGAAVGGVRKGYQLGSPELPCVCPVGRPPWRVLARRPRRQLAVLPEPVDLPGAARSGRNPASQGGEQSARRASGAERADSLRHHVARLEPTRPWCADCA